jgi:hypothetical protein
MRRRSKCKASLIKKGRPLVEQRKLELAKGKERSRAKEFELKAKEFDAHCSSRRAGS